MQTIRELGHEHTRWMYFFTEFTRHRSFSLYSLWCIKSFLKAIYWKRWLFQLCSVLLVRVWAKHYILQGKDVAYTVCECVVCVVYPFCLFVQSWPRVIYRLFGMFCHLVSLNGPLFSYFRFASQQYIIKMKAQVQPRKQTKTTKFAA